MTQSAPRRLRQTLGQLALAAINATLILVALCLFLAWQTVSAVERVGERAASAVAEQLSELSPVADSVDGLRTEIAALRGDLGALGSELGEPGEALAERLENLNDRVARVEDRLDTAADRVGATAEALSTDQGRLVERAVEAGVDRAGVWVAGLLNCKRPPGAPEAKAPASAAAAG